MAEPLAMVDDVPNSGRCWICDNALDLDGPGLYSCPICSIAAREGRTIEQVRREVEQVAGDWTAVFASAEGKHCNCGAEPPSLKLVAKDGETNGIVDYRRKHKRGCPLGRECFSWGPIDLELRERFSI